MSTYPQNILEAADIDTAYLDGVRTLPDGTTALVLLVTVHSDTGKVYTADALPQTLFVQGDDEQSKRFISLLHAPEEASPALTINEIREAQGLAPIAPAPDTLWVSTSQGPIPLADDTAASAPESPAEDAPTQAEETPDPLAETKQVTYRDDSETPEADTPAQEIPVTPADGPMPEGTEPVEDATPASDDAPEPPVTPAI